MARTRGTPRSTRPTRGRLDPRREIELHVLTEGRAKGWIHTHGLAAHGKPELEIRDLPLFLRPAAAALLNDVADYLLNDASTPLLAGQVVEFGASTFRVVEARADEDAGYDRGHYDGCVRLLVVDPPEDRCECEECAADRARRPPWRADGSGGARAFLPRSAPVRPLRESHPVPVLASDVPPCWRGEKVDVAVGTLVVTCEGD